MKFEFCQYGYWVGPNGEIEAITGWQQHKVAAPGICDRYGLDYDASEVSSGVTKWNAERALSEARWTAVTASYRGGEGGLEFECDAYDPPGQVKALIAIVRSHGKTEPGFRIGHRHFDTTRETLRHLADLLSTAGKKPPRLSAPKRGLSRGARGSAAGVTSPERPETEAGE